MSSILGVLFAMLVGMMVLPNYVSIQQSSNENVRGALTAQQQKQVFAAAAVYIQQNGPTLQAMATPTTPVIITVPMLQSIGQLAGFNAVNPYSQTWQVQVLQPNPTVLQSLVTAQGGQVIPDKQLARIAALVGASGGFVPQNDSGTFPGGAANAFGAFSGWQVSTANYSPIGGGHPAALLTVTAGQVVSNYLYRNAVPGQPQLNQMNTSLGMQGNNIANVNAFDAKLGNFSRDGQATCCAPDPKALSVSEQSASTGRRPAIQFHAGGWSEGFIELGGGGPSNEPRRFNLRDNQGAGAGLDASGTISTNKDVTAGGNMTAGSNVTAGGNVNAANVLVPTYGGVYMGPATAYSNGNDMVLRQPGGAYIVKQDGSVAPLLGVKDIQSTNGVITTANSWWSMITRDGGGNDNSAQRDAQGSIHVNDIWIRSIGKWASDLNQPPPTSTPAFTYSTKYNIPGGSYSYGFGVHKMCTISGTQSNYNTTVGNSWSSIDGSWNGYWSWSAYGHAPDFSQVICYD